MIANGQARGVLPAGHELLVTRARSVALREADLVIVAGTPLDFRLGYGSFGPKEAPAQVVHVADVPARIATHVPLAASAAGEASAFFAHLTTVTAVTGADPGWAPRLAEAVRAAQAADAPLLASDAEPVHPARIYGELLKVLDDDAVVIGDGGDFVSFAGKYVEPRRPGGWLDPGPFGCLGTGLGYAIAARIARPSAQVVLLLGDGAPLVADGRRHAGPAPAAGGHRLREQRRLGAWSGTRCVPFTVTTSPPTCSRAAVTTRWSAPSAARASSSPRPPIGPALRRAFAANTPYLVNVVTDAEIAYPRSTAI